MDTDGFQIPGGKEQEANEDLPRQRHEELFVGGVNTVLRFVDHSAQLAGDQMHLHGLATSPGAARRVLSSMVLVLITAVLFLVIREVLLIKRERASGKKKKDS